MGAAKKLVRELNWKPVRRGKLYCSPACGGGCTIAQYEAARADADKLCKRLGAGWKPRIWENLGWHYQAVSPCGRYKVIANGRGMVADRRPTSYTAFLGPADCIGGGKWAEHGKTPERAIMAVKKAALADLGGIQDLLKGI